MLKNNPEKAGRQYLPQAWIVIEDSSGQKCCRTGLAYREVTFMGVAWQIGNVMQNRFRIHNILRGGMGIIYIVYDLKWHHVYAAKTFQDEVFARSPVMAKRFRQEAIAWINLDIHQNIADALFVEDIEGKPYLFLEYVSGGDLSKWIGTPRLTEDLQQVLHFAIQLCDGLTHALSKGIKAHRDIKPQNCLITEDGQLKVTDFGLAKVFDVADMDDFQHKNAGSQAKAEGGLLRRLFSRHHTNSKRVLGPKMEDLNINLTRTGVAAGTPPYMAPEQFDDAKNVDLRADIYSFGVILFQMLTGKLPYNERTWQDYERSHKHEPVPSLSSSQARFKSKQVLALDLIIQNCLVKDRARRFGDFSAVRDGLVRIYEEVTGENAPSPAVGLEPGPAVGLELSASYLYQKGRSLSSLGENDEAVRCFDQALKLNPRLAEAWDGKGLVMASLGRLKESLDCFDRALTLNPRLYLTFSHKGSILARLGRLQEAFFCHNRALEHEQFSPDAWNNMASTLARLGQISEAIDCYDRALILNPNFEKAWSNKGVALAAAGRLEEALTCYTRALEIKPNDDKAWSNKANLLARLKRVEEALLCYNRALKIDPHNVDTLFSKGATLRDAKRLKEALACFEEAARLGDREAIQEAVQLRQRLAGG